MSPRMTLRDELCTNPAFGPDCEVYFSLLPDDSGEYPDRCDAILLIYRPNRKPCVAWSTHYHSASCGLCAGHYDMDYHKAEADFAARVEGRY